MEPLQIACVDNPQIFIPNRFTIAKIDERNMQTILKQLHDRFANFSINGDNDYDDVWDCALEAIGVAKPIEALDTIEYIHTKHQGEPGNEDRYWENIKLYQKLADQPYVAIPVTQDLADNTTLPNGHDIDELYTAEVVSIIEELNQNLLDAYEVYNEEHSAS